MAELITVTDQGLWCARGGFHVDPWRKVETAVITHAHGDHARPGSKTYHAAASSVGLLRRRLGDEARIVGHPFGERFRLGEVTVSLHPAGHVLGSAQVRVEGQMAERSEVWVVSGDYKRGADPSCEAFELVPCDVFITEATFALPIYRWSPVTDVVDEIEAWWASNRAERKASVLAVYALGKAQRVLAELGRRDAPEVLVHGAIETLLDPYREAGIRLAPTRTVGPKQRGESFEGALILAPPSAAGGAWMRRFGEASTGFASGWMRVRGNRRRHGYDRGFVLSDHVDWPDLLQTIRETGATKVYATHGYSDTLARYLTGTGLAAEPLATLYEGEAESDADLD